MNSAAGGLLASNIKYLFEIKNPAKKLPGYTKVDRAIVPGLSKAGFPFYQGLNSPWLTATINTRKEPGFYYHISPKAGHLFPSNNSYNTPSYNTPKEISRTPNSTGNEIIVNN